MYPNRSETDVRATCGDDQLYQNVSAPGPHRQKEYKELLARIQNAPKDGSQNGWRNFVYSLTQGRKSLLTWIKVVIAPLIILVLIVGTAIVYGRNKQKPADWVRIHTNLTRQEISLPDGSKILLRNGSLIEYPPGFGKSHRNVQFSGEGFFETRSDSPLPLVVSTCNGITTDMGASFLIRSHDSVEQIIVSRGRLKFTSSRDHSQCVFLSSGQEAQLVGNRIYASPVRSSNFLAWQNEKLVFQATPLNQVAEDLYNYFGVRVRFGPEVNPSQQLLTAQFEHQPMESILADIAQKVHLSLEREGRDYVLHSPVQVPSLVQQPAPDASLAKPAPKTPSQVSVAKKKKKKWWKFWKEG